MQKDFATNFYAPNKRTAQENIDRYCYTSQNLTVLLKYETDLAKITLKSNNLLSVVAQAFSLSTEVGDRVRESL